MIKLYHYALAMLEQKYTENQLVLHSSIIGVQSQGCYVMLRRA